MSRIIMALLTYLSACNAAANEVAIYIDNSTSMLSPPALGTAIPDEPRVTQVYERLQELAPSWPPDLSVYVRFWGTDLWPAPAHYGGGAELSVAVTNYLQLGRDTKTMLAATLQRLKEEGGAICTHLVIITDELTSDMDDMQPILTTVLESAVVVTIVVVESINRASTVKKYAALAPHGDNYQVLALSQITNADLLRRLQDGVSALPGYCHTIG